MDLRLLAASAFWGVCTAAPFVALRAIRQRGFHARKTINVFIAGAMVPTYFRLLRAALLQSVQDLPPDWPTFVGLAAVVALGLAITELVKQFRYCWRKPVAAKTEPQQGGDGHPP